jgi:hypothetical protein
MPSYEFDPYRESPGVLTSGIYRHLTSGIAAWHDDHPDTERRAVIRDVVLENSGGLSISIQEGPNNVARSYLDENDMSHDGVVTLYCSRSDRIVARYAVMPSRVVDLGGFEDVYDDNLPEIYELTATYEEQEVGLDNPIPKDRRNAMRRVIGPLVIAETLDAAQAPQPLEYSDVVDRILEGDLASIAPLVEHWTEQQRDFSSLNEATGSLGALLQVAISDHYVSELSGTLTERQMTLFHKYTYNGEFEGATRDTIQAQALITGSLALPAYLAAHFDLHTPDELLATMNRLPVAYLTDTLMEPNFAAGLMDLTGAINGALGAVIHPINLTSQEGLDDEEPMFEPGYPRASPVALDMGAIQRAKAQSPEAFAALNQFDVYNLFVKTDQGTVLNPDYARAGAHGMRLENTYDHGDNNRTTPSMGCPAVITHTRISPLDLTPEQLAIMSERHDVVVDTSKAAYTRLHFTKNPILSLHRAHVQTLHLFA